MPIVDDNTPPLLPDEYATARLLTIGAEEPYAAKLLPVSEVALNSEVQPRLTAAESGLADTVELVSETLSSGRRGYATWSSMNADATQPNKTLGEVPVTDTGTHTDPVVGGTVANNGVFRYSTSPAGWERLYDMPPGSVATNAESLAGASATKSVPPAGLKHTLDTRFGVDDGLGTLGARVVKNETDGATSRQSIIDLGATATQDQSQIATAGYLYSPSFSSPATRRTITRGASTITIAVTLQQSWLFTFEDRDVKGGRIYTAEFTPTAATATIYGFGIGITTEVRADGARGDATDLTVWDSGTDTTVTTRAFIMRNNGVVQCVTNPAIGSGNVTNSATILTNNANGTTFTLNDRIRVEATVPDDDTTDRRIVWQKQTAGAGPWINMGFITVAAADWPLASEPCAAGHSNNPLTTTIHLRNVRGIAATSSTGDTQVRYVNPAGAGGGDGDRDTPVQSILSVAASITETSKRLKIVLKGGTHRVTSTFSIAHDAYEEVEFVSASGEIADIRGTLVPGTWTVDGSEPTVWWVPNYYAGVISSAAGHVISYAPDAIDWAGAAAPGASIRALQFLGNNVAVATMAAETVPSCSLNTSNGRMYIVLPNGENPNSVGSLELVQVDKVAAFNGPIVGALPFCPRLIMENFKMSGGITNALRVSLWSVLADNVLVGGAVSDVVDFRECSGQLYRFRSHGANNDCVKTSLYDPAGGSTARYSDVDRPMLQFFDPEFLGAIIGDNLSNHQGGGMVSLRGGLLGYAGKHNMSMIEGFSVSGTRLLYGADGGIMVAFADDAKATINDVYVEDALYGLIADKQAATTHVITMDVNGLTVVTPNALTDRGIYLFNAAAAGTMKLNLSRFQVDSAIPSGDRRVGFAGATVVEQTLV